ncbi:MAG: T9SS type A sorting domain-containing protein [Bacteroidia bacterium]
MKNFIFVLLIFPVKNIYSQTYLNEQFNYGSLADTLCGTGGVTTNWTPFANAGNNPMYYQPANLVYSGYSGTATSGGSLQFTIGSGSREGVNTAVPALNSGSVYISFLLKITSGGTTGNASEYFMHLNDTFGSSLSSSTIGRLFLKNVNGSSAFQLGLSKGSPSGGAVFTSSNYSFGSTFLVVMKYKFNSTSSSDDSVFAWIFTSGVPSTEPAPQLIATDVSVTDLPRIRSLCVRQGSNITATALIDVIKVGNTWTNALLPVKWLDISARLENKNAVSLNWSTASEINNDRFEIEKSIDHSSWIMAGTVKGNGNSNSVHSYQFTDVFPLKAGLDMTNLSTNQPVNLFYRLKQVDLDGNFQYSEVVSVDLERLMNNDAAIFPNPFTNSLTVNSSTPVTVSIYNMEGRLVLQKEISGNENINTENFVKEIYFVELKSKNEVRHFKIFKE